MSQILINDLNPNETFLYTLTEVENLSIIGGRPKVHERWWFKALVKIGVGVTTAVIASELTGD